MKFTDRLLDSLVVCVVWILFWCLRRSWNFEEDPLPLEVQERLRLGKPVVFAHLHEDEWALLGAFVGRPMTVLVSQSQDGSRMTRFLKTLGFEVFRGSSSRGGVGGLLSLVRHAKKSNKPVLSLAIDGPRGPRGVAKPGIALLARSLGAPVVVGVAKCKPGRAWVFTKSWSQAFVPKPFAKVRIVYGMVAWSDELADLSRDEVDQELCRRVETELASAKTLAD